MGLDPLANRQAREIAQAQADAQPNLEPDFPYSRVSFDPFFFGVVERPQVDNSAQGN